MLLLHGVGHRWQAWTPVLDRLDREFDMVALDLPGHGKSPMLPPDQRHHEAAVTSLEDVLDALGWERAHIVGNSLGGWGAFELAVRGRATSICAFAPAGLWDPETIYRRLRFWFGFWVGSSRKLSRLTWMLAYAPVRTVMMGGLFGRPWRIPADIAVEDARNLATSAVDEAFKAGRGLRFEGGQAIDVPVTVAWGSRDPLFRPRRCPVHELPSHTRVLTLRGCGHVPTWDDPELVTDTIRSTTSRARAPVVES